MIRVNIWDGNIAKFAGDVKLDNFLYGGLFQDSTQETARNISRFVRKNLSQEESQKISKSHISSYHGKRKNKVDGFRF